MRTLFGATVVLLLVVVLWTGVAAAMCVAPTLDVDPPVASPGEQIHISGENWIVECNDTGAARSTPARDVVLTFLQGDRVWHLPRTDADGSYRILTTATVPQDARPGRATIAGDRSESHALVDITVEVTTASSETPSTEPAGGLAQTGTGIGGPFALSLFLVAMGLRFVTRRQGRNT